MMLTSCVHPRGLAFLWANFHWRLMAIFGKLGLLDDDNIYAVPRVLLGATGVVTIGMFLPQTLFWGEWEFPVLATLSPASDLPHVWPTSGLLGFEMDSGLNCVIVGFCKLIAISFTVAGGYRGGFSKSIPLPFVYGSLSYLSLNHHYSLFMQSSHFLLQALPLDVLCALYFQHYPQ